MKRPGARLLVYVLAIPASIGGAWACGARTEALVGEIGSDAGGLDVTLPDAGEGSSSESGGDSGHESSTGDSAFDTGSEAATTCKTGTGLVRLATGLRRQPLAVAVDANNVYWTNTGYPPGPGSVMKVPVCGGEAKTLASDRGSPQFIASDATSVYWTDSFLGPMGAGNALVMKVPIDGGALVTLASVPQASVACGIAVDALSVYWGTMTGSNLSPAPIALMKVPIGGGTPTTLASEAFPGAFGSQCGIAVDATSVYWTTQESILKVPLGGGTVSTLLVMDPPFAPTAVAMNATSLFWTTQGGPTVRQFVMKIPLGGGVPTTLASPEDSLNAIAVDDANVYWTGDSAVLKMPVQGGSATTLNDFGANGIALGATSVYWVRHGGNSRVATLDDAIVRLTPK